MSEIVNKKKKNKIQGYNLSHEDMEMYIDDIEFWKQAAEEYYLSLKYDMMNRPSRKKGKYRSPLPCDISKEKFLELYKEHKQQMKQNIPKSDGRICKYCEKRLTYMVGYKNTNVSVDRLDNTKGYLVNNIIFACGGCNDTKNQVTLEMCENIIRVKNEVE
tara:strand:+ start:44 stop:523 length:480 start_codon:yes stop_codon:yes gene_type:complete